MKQKIIGITPRYYLNDEGKKFLRVSQFYLDYIQNQNIISIILTPSENLSQILDLCDGFLVLGGDDMDPTYYGETNDLGLSKEIDPVIDIIDQQVIEYAVANKKPMLGICRGIQSIVAFLGGSLYQDINHFNLNHPHEGIYHNVTKVENFGVAKLLPDEFMVNTYHHQCPKVLPKGFKKLFVNHDIIEMVEHESLPIIATQWHPERINTKESKIIVDYFISKL